MLPYDPLRRAPNKSAPRTLKRVRKESKTLLSDSFRTILRLRGALFRDSGGLFRDSFRTLLGFRARRARETLCQAGPFLTPRDPGHPGKIPGTPHLPSEGGHELFDPHPLAWKTLTPPDIRPQKVNLCALFSCLIVELPSLQKCWLQRSCFLCPDLALLHKTITKETKLLEHYFYIILDRSWLRKSEKKGTDNEQRAKCSKFQINFGKCCSSVRGHVNLDEFPQNAPSSNFG